MIPILCKQPEKEEDNANLVRVTACAATLRNFGSRLRRDLAGLWKATD